MRKQVKVIVILFLIFGCSSTYKLHRALEKMKDEHCQAIITRETIAEINKLGVVIKNNYEDYLLRSEEGMLYFACNLPEEFKKEGMEVIFTGEEKEMYSNEKAIGKFLILNNISKK